MGTDNGMIRYDFAHSNLHDCISSTSAAGAGSGNRCHHQGDQSETENDDGERSQKVRSCTHAYLQDERNVSCNVKAENRAGEDEAHRES